MPLPFSANKQRGHRLSKTGIKVALDEVKGRVAYAERIALHLRHPRHLSRTTCHRPGISCSASHGEAGSAQTTDWDIYTAKRRSRKLSHAQRLPTQALYTCDELDILSSLFTDLESQTTGREVLLHETTRLEIVDTVV